MYLAWSMQPRRRNVWSAGLRFVRQPAWKGSIFWMLCCIIVGKGVLTPQTKIKPHPTMATPQLLFNINPTEVGNPTLDLKISSTPKMILPNYYFLVNEMHCFAKKIHETLE